MSDHDKDGIPDEVEKAAGYLKYVIALGAILGVTGIGSFFAKLDEIQTWISESPVKIAVQENQAQNDRAMFAYRLSQETATGKMLRTDCEKEKSTLARSFSQGVTSQAAHESTFN